MSRRAPLNLDFVASVRRSPWPGLLLLAMALGIALYLVVRYQHTRIEVERLNVLQGLVAPTSTDTSRKGAKRDDKDNRTDEQTKDAQATVRQLALPWAALITALESSTSNDVAVLQVQPEAQQQLVRITAEARDHRAMLVYVDKLQQNQILRNIHWLNHQYQNDDPQRPLQFSLQAAFGDAQ